MIIDNLCPPAVLYLGFSIIQIIIDLFRGQQNIAFLKVIVMIIFTILLNQLCMGGLTILSWFIVFIPFIMMTYVTTILLYVFGLNPSKGKYQPQPDPRSMHAKKNVPQPYNHEKLNCTETQFGCCPDGASIRNNITGSNCPSHIKPYSGFGRYFYWQFSKPTSTPSAAPSATPSGSR